MEFSASSHRSCFFCTSRDNRYEASLSESVQRVSHSLFQHDTEFFRWTRGIHCLPAYSRLSQKSWYAISIFDVSGGGNLSTDSSVKRQKRFQSALRKSQRFTGSLWATTLRVSCSTMMKALFLWASCSMTEILSAVSLSVFSWSMLGRQSSAAFLLPCPEKGVL